MGLYKVITCILFFQAISAVLADLAKPAEYPYVVSIHRKADNVQICAGALITNKTVLTAARCVVSAKPEEQSEANFYIKYNADQYEALSSKVQRIDINSSTITPHSGYQPSSQTSFRENDIALMTLVSEIANYSQVLSLPKHKEALNTSEALTVLGYHFNDDSMKYYLKYFEAWIIDNNQCLATVKNVRSNVELYETQFCTVHPTRTIYTLQGDSGTPLVRKLKDSHVLIGIASAASYYPDKNDRPIFTQVSLYSEWIESYLPNSSNHNATYGFLMMVLALLTVVKNFFY